MQRRFWVITLAMYFLLVGLLSLTNIVFAAQGTVLGVLALAIAVLAFLDR